MDGGPQEKVVVQGFKEIVKSTSRRKQGFILGRDRDGRGVKELGKSLLKQDCPVLSCRAQEMRL
jgi:hypothetical protein